MRKRKIYLLKKILYLEPNKLHFLKKEANTLENYIKNLNNEYDIKSVFLQQIYQMTTSIRIWSNCEKLTKKKYDKCVFLYKK